MESAKEKIAKKGMAIEMRRQSILEHRYALRENALQYCRRPSTLGIAAASGFVLARLLPPLLRSNRTPQPRRALRLLDPYLQMIPMLVFERLRHALIQRTQSTKHWQNTQYNQDMPESQ